MSRKRGGSYESVKVTDEAGFRWRWAALRLVKLIGLCAPHLKAVTELHKKCGNWELSDLERSVETDMDKPPVSAAAGGRAYGWHGVITVTATDPVDLADVPAGTSVVVLIHGGK
jgi:hypothetical protein